MLDSLQSTRRRHLPLSRAKVPEAQDGRLYDRRGHDCRKQKPFPSFVYPPTNVIDDDRTLVLNDAK